MEVVFRQVKVEFKVRPPPHWQSIWCYSNGHSICLLTFSNSIYLQENENIKRVLAWYHRKNWIFYGDIKMDASFFQHRMLSARVEQWSQREALVGEELGYKN